MKDHIKKMYEKEFSKVEDEDEKYELLRNDIDWLSVNAKEQIKEVISDFGLLYLFEKDEFDNLLNEQTVFDTICNMLSNLLKNNDLDTCLKWMNKYEKVYDNLKEELKSIIKTTIYPQTEKLIDFYNLFSVPENKIKDTEKILNDIADKIILNLSDIQIILDISEDENYNEITANHKDKFVKQISKVLENSKNQYEDLELLLENFDITELFLEKENALYKTVLEIINNLKDQRFEMFYFVDSLVKTDKKNKHIKKIRSEINMKHIITYFKEKTRRLVVMVAIICFIVGGVSGFLVWQLTNEITPAETNIPIIEQLQEQNNYLKKQLQYYENQYRYSDTVNNNVEFVPSGDSITN